MSKTQEGSLDKEGSSKEKPALSSKQNWTELFTLAMGLPKEDQLLLAKSLAGVVGLTFGQTLPTIIPVVEPQKALKPNEVKPTELKLEAPKDYPKDCPLTKPNIDRWLSGHYNWTGKCWVQKKGTVTPKPSKEGEGSSKTLKKKIGNIRKALKASKDEKEIKKLEARLQALYKRAGKQPKTQ